MCTVTVIPLVRNDDPGAFRLVSSRDEMRTRQSALEPRTVEAGHHTAVYPVDADAGGTWVAVNDAGLAMSLLNLNPGPDAPPAPPHAGRSRGDIIPALIATDGVAAALASVGRLDPCGQRPFRLVMADPRERAVVVGNGTSIEVVERTSDRTPFMITSSGLGDHIVEGPRRTVWDDAFDPAPVDLEAAQDAFHRHHDPASTHTSVSMYRDEAWTMSRTEVTVTAGGAELRHAAGLPHETPLPKGAISVPVRARSAG